MTAKPIAGSAVPDGAAFADAHRRLLEDTSIQFTLPQVEPLPPPPEIDPSTLDFLAGLMPVLRVLFWVAVAAGGLFLLYAIAMRLAGREWRLWRRSPRDEAADDSWRPEAGEARELLSEADALAAQGRFSEAAHLLLFRSIEDIDSRRPDLVRPALTSRDIAALDALPARPRGAFGRIAAMVERSLFAQRALEAPDWRDCRSAYEEFAFADGWRG